MWHGLVDRLDLGAYVPRPSPGVEARQLHDRAGDAYWVLRSPGLRYARLDEIDYRLWLRMDGERSIQQIALAHFVEHGGFVVERLARLVAELRAHGMLGRAPTDLFASLERRQAARSHWRRARGLVARLAAVQLVRFRHADAFFSLFYRHGGHVLFSRPANVLWALVIVVGLVVWWRQILLAEHALFQTNGSYTLGLITLAVLDVAGIVLHEVAQGLAIKRHGCRVNGAGVMLFYGVPVPYVETSDIWMADRRGRMAVSWAGPCAMLVLGGTLAIMATPLDGMEMGAFLFKAASIWLANALFNLLPILNLDGYFLLADYLDMPALRANAVAFVRGVLWERLRRRVGLTREEQIYTAFGLGSGAIVALIPVAILEARDLRYASSLAELWARPDPGGQAMAAGMALMFLGPAALTLGSEILCPIRVAVRFGVQRWRQARGEAAREYIEALAGLPFLSGVARHDLVSIAGHLQPEEPIRGEVVIRQGAPGDRFFVVVEGRLSVTRTTSAGVVERLAVLGPGDYVGEAALIADVPRTASVIAETPSRLLSLDAGHFRRWLQGRLDLDEAVHRSLADRARLSALPLFADCGPAELDRLAARMLVTRYLSGDVIIRQGEPGDRFYLIVDGRAEVVVEYDGESRQVAVLTVGDFFGELALLDSAPRSATVRAVTPVEAYTLDTSDFHGLLGELPASSAIQQVASDRAQQNALAFGDTAPGSP
ncbi:MAG: cyclic nucleotide-binding domain-containing protein [Chloroflexi bacterium]|nr:cyclic nucleotide-binding domain-containing protein [Chloroflexota bacterium]